jgi:hypothetical protein
MHRSLREIIADAVVAHIQKQGSSVVPDPTAPVKPTPGVVLGAQIPQSQPESTDQLVELDALKQQVDSGTAEQQKLQEQAQQAQQEMQQTQITAQQAQAEAQNEAARIKGEAEIEKQKAQLAVQQAKAEAASAKAQAQAAQTAQKQLGSPSPTLWTERLKRVTKFTNKMSAVPQAPQAGGNVVTNGALQAVKHLPLVGPMAGLAVDGATNGPMSNWLKTYESENWNPSQVQDTYFPDRGNPLTAEQSSWTPRNIANNTWDTVGGVGAWAGDFVNNVGRNLAMKPMSDITRGTRDLQSNIAQQRQAGKSWMDLDLGQAWDSGAGRMVGGTAQGIATPLMMSNPATAAWGMGGAIGGAALNSGEGNLVFNNNPTPPEPQGPSDPLSPYPNGVVQPANISGGQPQTTAQAQAPAGAPGPMQGPPGFFQYLPEELQGWGDGTTRAMQLGGLRYPGLAPYAGNDVGQFENPYLQKARGFLNQFDSVLTGGMLGEPYRPNPGWLGMDGTSTPGTSRGAVSHIPSQLISMLQQNPQLLSQLSGGTRW